MSIWYEHSDSDKSPIISSRIRLARNLANYPFSAKLTKDSARTMIGDVCKSLASSNFSFIEPAKEDIMTRLSMVENHDISPEVLKYGADRPFALLKGRSPGTSVMLGEEDHIRIQAITSGNNLDRAYAEATDIDDNLERALDYAYHKDFGYLTSCPTNTGTGLRASFMAHIPMIEKTGSLTNLINNLSKLGMTVRGIYGEGSKPFGSIYQVSNQVTLGKSEDEIIAELKSVGSQLIESELSLLQSAFTRDPMGMEDIIYRALGLLSHARKLTVNEAMESLSAIRVGILSGVLKPNVVNTPVYSIMMNIEPGNLQKIFGKHLSESDILIQRARYLREIFSR